MCSTEHPSNPIAVLLADWNYSRAKNRTGLAYMNLVAKGLNVARDLKILLEALHRLWVLILGSKHADRYSDTLGIFWVNHGWMNLCSSAERCARLSSQGYNLPSSAFAL